MQAGSNGTKGGIFANLIKTDGYSADVVIYKPSPKPSDSSNDYMIEDLHEAIEGNYDLKSFSVTAVDPGRSCVFTAASGCNNGEYQIRRCTRKEYNSLSGSTRMAKQELKRSEKEGMLETLKSKPTHKTVSLQKHILYLEHMKSNMQHYFTFYRSETAKKRFHLYQGRQRALDEMANILVDGGKKYNPAKRKRTKQNRKTRKRTRKKKRINQEQETAVAGVFKETYLKDKNRYSIRIKLGTYKIQLNHVYIL